MYKDQVTTALPSTLSRLSTISERLDKLGRELTERISPIIINTAPSVAKNMDTAAESCVLHNYISDIERKVDDLCYLKESIVF